MRDENSVPGLRRGPEFHAGFWAGPVAPMMGVAGSGGSHGVRTSMRDSMRDPASSRFDRRATRGALKENRTIVTPLRECWCRLRFSVSCIVVAILGYGMMSMYWCCRLSFESVVVLCPGLVSDLCHHVAIYCHVSDLGH